MLRPLLDPGSEKSYVLVVQQAEPGRIVLQDMLVNLGYCVHHARDGASALEQTATRPYDLLITEVNLPDMDASAWVKRVLASLPDPKPPVIGVVEHDSPELLEQMAQAGIRHTLRKPIQPHTLVSAILKATGAEPSQVERAMEGMASPSG